MGSSELAGSLRDRWTTREPHDDDDDDDDERRRRRRATATAAAAATTATMADLDGDDDKLG